MRINSSNLVRYPEGDRGESNHVPQLKRSNRLEKFLKTDLSLVTAGSIESILPIRPETKNYMVQRNRCVRISIGPRPRLKDSKPKSKVTHLHLGSSLPTAVMDLEAVPNHDSSVALVFRGKKHKKKFLPGLEGMEMIIDGEPRSAEVQIVNTLEDIEITNWFLSVKLMDMITLKTLLQEFFSDRSSLPISLFYSDDSDILSDGGLFIRYDNLPIPLGKYHFDCLVSNTGAKRAIGAEPAASCRICHPPASMANGNGPAKQEMETLRKGLLSYNPEDKLKDNVQISSCKSIFQYFLLPYGTVVEKGFMFWIFSPRDSVKYDSLEIFGPRPQERNQFGIFISAAILFPLPLSPFVRWGCS